MAVTTAKTIGVAACRVHLSHRGLFTTDLPRPRRLLYRGLQTAASDVHQDEKARIDARAFIHPRMIFVRPWDGIPTMVHAFAIVRDIERRFGEIREFFLLRDPDVPSKFSPFMHATFVETRDADAIPLEGKVIQVATPKVDAQREGGVGLDDLSAYLDPEARAAALSRTEGIPPEKGDVMDVKLERTGLRDLPSATSSPFRFGRRGPSHIHNPMRMRELAHAITSFGGFVDGEAHGGETRMQAIVSKWSHFLKQDSRPGNVEEAGERRPINAAPTPRPDSGSDPGLVDPISSDISSERNPAASEEENKATAQKWWEFLNSGKSQADGKI